MASRSTRGRHERTPLPTYGSRTDVGLVREHNEDSLVVRPPLFAVADGMGGHAAGEVASEIAAQTLIEDTPDNADAQELARVVVQANRNIIVAARQGRGRKGMGTTLTCAIVDRERLLVAQVGDSRAYLLHDGVLQRLTRDHSLVADLVESGQISEEEARVHPNRSVITRALGSDPHTLPDIYEINVKAGDRLLLCSDGLTSMVRDDDIAKTMRRIHDAQDCADTLVDQALDAGGHDNVTTIVVDIPGNAEAKRKKIALKSRFAAILGAIALAAIFIGSAFAGHAYLNHIAFLTVNEGQVVICRGLPGEVLGIKTWSYDHSTGVDIASLDLPPNTLSRLTDEGIRVDSVEAAEDLVATWQSQDTNPSSSKSAAARSSSGPSSKGGA
nr:Stp1/IreP family PP2C-type Ser/Thr phosphatase [Slackia sp. CM382]